MRGFNVKIKCFFFLAIYVYSFIDLFESPNSFHTFFLAKTIKAKLSDRECSSVRVFFSPKEMTNKVLLRLFFD